MTVQKVAVLGTGSIGMRHLRLLQGRDGVEAIAVPTRAERVGQLREEGFTASSLDNLSGVDAAVVATDTGRHLADAHRALAAGARALLIEKPLASSSSELGPRPSDASVFVGYNLRFAATVQKLSEWLPEIGPVHEAAVHARSFLPGWRPERDYRETYSARPGEGGVLRDLSHEVDLALWLFGDAGSHLGGWARCTGRLGIQADDAAHLAWVSSRGIGVTVGVDYLTRPPTRGIVAFGEQGQVKLDLLSGEVVKTTSAGEHERFVADASDVQETYARQMTAFLAAAAGDPSPVLATWDEGRRVVEVSDAVRGPAGGAA